MATDDKTLAPGGFLHGLLRFPILDREQRVDLSERIRASSTSDTDFVFMMVVSTALAALGLMQGSTAVVIGAMLVAPLMGSLLGAGLALTQGNVQLFLEALKTVVVGIFIAIGVSTLVGLLNPGYEPSLEIEARGNPDLLDLGIAFASGMAASYAQARPNVASSLAGVAIAAALVPPLAVVGIALTNDRPMIAANAGILLMTNVVAIILGAALIFRMLGLKVPHAEGEPEDRRGWVRAATLGLILFGALLVAPLLINMVSGANEGQSRPLAYPTSRPVRDGVRAFMAAEPSVELLRMGRDGIEPDHGISVMLMAYGEVRPGLEDELRAVILEARERVVPIDIFTLEAAHHADP